MRMQVELLLALGKEHTARENVVEILEMNVLSLNDFQYTISTLEDQAGDLGINVHSELGSLELSCAHMIKSALKCYLKSVAELAKVKLEATERVLGEVEAINFEID